MHAFKQLRARQIAAGLLSLTLLLLALFSALFIASHAQHDCAGEDCPVCACIERCARLLHGADARLELQKAALPVSAFVLCTAAACILAFAAATPVSTKVKLNN